MWQLKTATLPQGLPGIALCTQPDSMLWYTCCHTPGHAHLLHDRALTHMSVVCRGPSPCMVNLLALPRWPANQAEVSPWSRNPPCPQARSQSQRQPRRPLPGPRHQPIPPRHRRRSRDPGSRRSGHCGRKCHRSLREQCMSITVNVGRGLGRADGLRALDISRPGSSAFLPFAERSPKESTLVSTPDC
jgi:hypothetical protein